MARTTLFRISCALTLLAVLSLAPQISWAGTARHSRNHPAAAQAPSTSSLVSQAWHRLVHVWGGVGTVIDPNGSSLSTSTAPPSTTVPRDGN
jgi:hypothetical protein